MGIPWWKSALFFMAILLLSIAIFPTGRQLGKFYHYSKNFDDADLYLSSRYDRDPSDEGNSQRYLSSLLFFKDFDKFEEISDELLTVIPESFLLHEVVARYHEERMRYQEASFHWDKMLELMPIDANVRDKLVSYYSINQQYDKLIKVYERDISVAANNLDSYYSLALLYSLRHDITNAKRIYSKIIEDFPYERKSKIRLAQLHEYSGDVALAISLYRRVSEENPEDRSAMVALGNKLLSYSEVDGFMSFLERFQGKYPGDTLYYDEQASLYLGIKDRINAIALIEKEYLRSPDNLALLFSMGELYFEIKDYSKALDILEKYNSKTTKDDYRSYHLLGDVFAAVGDKASSVNAYEHAFELVEYNVPQDSFSDDIVNEKSYTKKLSLYEEYRSRFPEKAAPEAEVSYAVAVQEAFPLEDVVSRTVDMEIAEVWILWKLGRHDEAIAKSDELSKQHPNNTELTYFLINSYFERNMTAKARKLYDVLEMKGPYDANLKELKFSLLIQEGRWSEAYALSEEFLVESPFNDYSEDRVYILTKMKRWREAKNIYEEKIAARDAAGAPHNDRYIWDARSAIEEGSDLLWSDVIYEHDSNTERHYTIEAGCRSWLSESLRLSAVAAREYHKRDEEENPVASAVSDNVSSITLRAEKFLNYSFTAEGHVSLPSYGDETFPEFGVKALYNRTRFYDLESYISYTHDRLSRDLDKLPIEMQYNTLEAFGKVYPNNILSLDYLFRSEWYHLPGKYNTVNGNSSLGYKIWNEVELGILLMNRPSWNLSLINHVYQSHWVKPFDEAGQVVDLGEKEKAWYGGLYGEFFVKTLSRTSWSLYRKHNSSKGFYSTLFAMSSEFWVRDDAVLTISLDHKYKDDTADIRTVSNDITANFKVLL